MTGSDFYGRWIDEQASEIERGMRDMGGKGIGANAAVYVFPSARNTAGRLVLSDVQPEGAIDVVRFPAQGTRVMAVPYSHLRCGPTEEGWHHLAESWEYEDGIVRNVETNDGADCDGRYAGTFVCVCPFHALASLCTEGERPAWVPGVPNWQRVALGQRDYSAEAMGY